METRGKKRLRELIENREEEPPHVGPVKIDDSEKTSNDNGSDSPKKTKKVKLKQDKPKSSVTKSNKKMKTNPIQGTLANLPESPFYIDEEYLNSIKVSFTLDPTSITVSTRNKNTITDNDRKFNSNLSDGWATCKGRAQFSEGKYYYEVEIRAPGINLVFLGVTDSKENLTQFALPLKTRSTFCHIHLLGSIIGYEVKPRKIGVLVDMINRDFVLFTEKKKIFRGKLHQEIIVAVPIFSVANGSYVLMI